MRYTMNRKVIAVFAALFLVATVGFASGQFVGGVFHVVGDIQLHDNDPTSDWNTAVAETAVILLDGSTGGVMVGGPFRFANSQDVIADSDATPDVSGGSYFITGDVTDDITDFDGTGIAIGQIIFVESDAAITYDVTGAGLVCGDTDIITAAGDSTGWFYDGTDWHCFFFQDLDDDANIWGDAT
jgi:hypothetical protein